MNFKPLHDRVLVKRVESDQKTAGFKNSFSNGKSLSAS
jgi:hypothetical protein